MTDVDDICWDNVKTVVLMSARMTYVDESWCNSVNATVVSTHMTLG